MDETRSAEKQKRLDKQQEQRIQKEETLAAEQSVTPLEETEAKSHAKRRSRMKETTQRFSAELILEWGREETLLSVNPGVTGVKLKTSLSDFEKLTSSKKRSGSAIELRNCLREMKELANGREAEVEDYVEKLFELSMASHQYCDSHRGSSWTISGGERAMIARKIRRMTKGCLSKLLTAEEEEEVKSNADADFEMGESMKSVTKDLTKAAKAYRRFSAQIGSDCQAYTPQEILKRKMQALRANERKIKLYRMNVSDEEWDPLIREMIEVYEEGLRWEKIRTFTGKQEEKESDLAQVIETHMEEEGEIEHREKISFRDQNEGLEPAQLKGIEEIDNWLIRNFQNGGLAGAALSCVKNSHGDFVSAVLSLTKRERLHMYYLVQTGKRKEPGLVDVGTSQSVVFVPELDTFKKQMLATKWKFWKRVTGGYTYMNKLDQAFRITRQYRTEILSLSGLKSEEKALSGQTGSKESSGSSADQPALQRMNQLLSLKAASEEYYRNLQAANKATGKKKEAEEIKCREAAAYCQELLKEVVKLDNAVGKAEVTTQKAEEKTTVAETGSSMYGALTTIPAKIQSGISAGSEFFGGSWHLENAGWGKFNLWSGSIASASDCAASLVGAVTTFLSLKDEWGQLSKEERSEKILTISQSFVSMADSAITIRSLVETGGILSKDITASAVTETAGTVAGIAGSVISGGIAIAKTVGAKNMVSHGAKAGDFFLEKRKDLAKQQAQRGDVSKEKKRELKYEKNMMFLQNDLAQREGRNASIAWVEAGLSVVSIAIPGIGVVSAGFALVSSILDSKAVTGIRTRLFDNFFHMDSLVEKAGASKDAKRLLKLPDEKSVDREQFREALRKRAAASAGFCDIHSAAIEICTRFAKLIRSKLFGGKAENEKERDGYREFVRSLNLSYDEEKGYPEENILVRKLSAQ